MPVGTDILFQKDLKNHSEIKSDIQCIRDWVSLQTHLPMEYITDFDLILAYHCCERCIESTKKVIDLNYTLRTLFTFYQNRKLDSSLEAALNSWLITPLESPTKKGYEAIYCQLLDTDPQKFIYSDVVRAFVMIMDLWLSTEDTISGAIIIVNMDKVSLGHITRIDLSIAQQFFYFLQEAMFIRLKEFHFINAPNFMDTVMSMVKPFMKKELLDMLKIHQVGSTSLGEYIPIKALPKEAGGLGKESTQMKDEIWEKLKLNEKFFDDESKKRVDESRRPGGPKTLGSFFGGLEGTFKHLQID